MSSFCAGQVLRAVWTVLRVLRPWHWHRCVHQHGISTRTLDHVCPLCPFCHTPSPWLNYISFVRGRFTSPLQFLRINSICASLGNFTHMPMTATFRLEAGWVRSLLYGFSVQFFKCNGLSLATGPGRHGNIGCSESLPERDYGCGCGMQVPKVREGDMYFFFLNKIELVYIWITR